MGPVGLAVLVLCAGRLLAAHRDESAEECDQAGQYFDRVESRCRNCSEAMHVFEASPDWQPYGVDGPPTGGPPSGDPLSSSSGARTDLMSGVIGPRLTLLPSNGRQTGRRGPAAEPHHNAADAILSRLVLDAQSSSADLAGSAAPGDGDDDLEPANSIASLGANPAADSSSQEHQLEEGESNEPRAQEQTNLARSARLWQRLLWDFVRSSEVSESGLLGAIEQCRSAQNQRACQMWANMCVMTMYSHSSDSAPFNNQLQAAARRRPTSRANGRVGDRLGETSDLKTSWQQCAKFDLVTICNSFREWRRQDKQQAPVELGDIFANEDVDAPPSRLGSLQNSHLRLGQQIQVVAYEYSFAGRLLSVHQYDLSDLSKFCLFAPTGSLARPDSEDMEIPAERLLGDSLRVGTNAQLRCRFSALQAGLLAPKHLNQTKFVDLFVGYQLNGAAFVKPVPVLLRNLLYQGQLVNLKHARDPSRWKFVHRYFPFATVKLGRTGGRTAADTREDAANQAANQDREALLFARSASFEIKLRRQQDKGLVISSMLLVLDYDHLQLVRGRRPDGPGWPAANSSALFESRIQVSQVSLDMQAYAKDLDLFVTIVCITSSIWSLIKCYNVQKYQGLIKLDIHSLCLFLLIACDIIANLLGIVTFAAALFLFVALKFPTLSDQQRSLAPDEALEQNLLLKLTLALAMKLLGLLYKLAVRLRADLFFIDWERPKMLTSTQILNQHRLAAAVEGAQAAKQQPFEHKPQYPAAGFLQQQQQQQIGFWRPYTIINRWMQMQTSRRQNLTLQLVAFVTLVELAQPDRLATSDSSFAWHADSGHPAGGPFEPKLAPKTSATFRALILALIYVALAAAQIFYKKYLHERMIRCPVREFVDLCSVGNVSLFCMLYPRYGFYVHGRSANGSADCGLLEMNVLLEREERDLCSRRGLLPESDQQTFVVVLPKIVNDHYRKLLFRADHTQLHAAPLTPNGNRSPTKRAQQPAEFIRSALSLPSSLANSAASPGRASSFSSARALIESVVARNRAINVFLINFLDHAYKDIDYSIRKRRRFENLLMEIDLSDEQQTTALQQASKLSRAVRGTNGAPSALGGDVGALGRTGGPLLGQHFDGANQLAASFFVDGDNSFASLIWLGLEWDLLMVELFALLNIDLLLGPKSLILSVGLVCLINKLLRSIYVSLARRNLVTKSMLDEKFVIRL